jgi:hypothetical protein
MDEAQPGLRPEQDPARPVPAMKLQEIRKAENLGQKMVIRLVMPLA